MTDPSPAPPGHEFSPEDAAVFADLGRWVKRAGVLLGALSVLSAALAVEAWWALWLRGPPGAFLGVLGLAGWVLAAVLGFTGWRLGRASARLRSVDTSAGEDVPHLMAALGGVCLSFRVLQRAAVAAVALGLLAFITHHGHG